MRSVVLLGVLMPALAIADAPSPAPSVEGPPLWARRWSVALALGPSTVKPNVDAGVRLEMTELQLSGRYRVRPELEFALSLVVGGGGGMTNDDVQLGGLMIDVRYRGYPTEVWNPYVYAGLGVMALDNKNDSTEAKKGRGAARIGVGIEHRWRAFAADAEVLGFAVAKNESVPDPAMPTTPYLFERYSVTGIAFVLGGSYYF